ncbi:MAG: type II secretion system F family protein [Nanoarchaeota archaeon]
MEHTLTKLRNLIGEVRVYEQLRTKLRADLKRLTAQYQAKKIDYLAYEKTLNHLLEGKSKREVLKGYDTYLKTLLDQIEAYTSHFFYQLYNDETFGPVPKHAVHPGKPLPKPAPELTVKVETIPVEVEPPKTKEIPFEISREEPRLEHIEKTKIANPFRRLRAFWKRLTHKKARRQEVMPWLKDELPKKKKKEPLKVQRDSVPTEELKSILTFSFVKAFFRRRREGQVLTDKTELDPVMARIRKLKDYREGIEESAVTDTLLRQEAKRIKGIIKERPQFHAYEPSNIGSIANMTVRKTSLFLIDTFPDVFKTLYNNLRAANIKILSNTYVNIIVLTVILSFLLFSTALISFFAVTSGSILQGLGKGIMSGVIAAIGTFLIFYSYPSMKIKQRRRSINTNLSFAINHMAAVAGSGVTPVAMFRLIAQAKEYEEISIEIEKIVTYIDLYGYDVMSAIKSVAATGPSPELSEFFSGFVSTIETGGELKNFLRQKSDEAMLNYRLERQKYLETISTYTDVYTGILIASPLFFVVALTLVNILGGTIGGLSVSTILVFGTYVMVPLLNIAFLIFLEMTQPEV